MVVFLHVIFLTMTHLILQVGARTRCDTAVRTQYVLHVTSPVSLLTQTHILYSTHSTHCLFALVVNYINYNYAPLLSSAVAEPQSSNDLHRHPDRSSHHDQFMYTNHIMLVSPQMENFYNCCYQLTSNNKLIELKPKESFELSQQQYSASQQ